MNPIPWYRFLSFRLISEVQKVINMLGMMQKNAQKEQSDQTEIFDKCSLHCRQFALRRHVAPIALLYIGGWRERMPASTRRCDRGFPIRCCLPTVLFCLKGSHTPYNFPESIFFVLFVWFVSFSFGEVNLELVKLSLRYLEKCCLRERPKCMFLKWVLKRSYERPSSKNKS